MTDDLSIGEVQRNVLRHESDLKDIRAEIVALARESVTVAQFNDGLSSFRRELSNDRELSEKLAGERHKAMITRLDRMDEATGKRIEALEVRELSRPMNAWMKFGIASASIVGVISLVINLVVTFVH